MCKTKIKYWRRGEGKLFLESIAVVYKMKSIFHSAEGTNLYCINSAILTKPKTGWQIFKQ